MFPERLENCSSRSTGLKHGTDVNQPLPKLYSGAGPSSQQADMAESLRRVI